MMDWPTAEIQLQLNKYIYDQNYLNARIIHKLAISTSQQESAIAKAAAGIYFFCLMFSKNAALLANLPLLIYPLILSTFFPQEAASPDQMLIYWLFFAGLTVFDHLFQSLIFYFPLKIVCLSSIFVYPRGAEKFILELKEKAKEITRNLVLESEELTLLEKKQKTESTDETSSSFLREKKTSTSSESDSDFIKSISLKSSSF